MHLPNGSFETITYGEEIRLAEDCKISLGSINGEIHWDPFFLCLSDDRNCALVVEKTISNLDVFGLSTSSPSDTIGEVCCNPNNQSIFELKNLSTKVWQVTLPNGEEVLVDTNNNIVLAEETYIDFGSIQGMINKF